MESLDPNKREMAEAVMTEDAVILATLAASDREQISIAREVMERRKDALHKLSKPDRELAE
jgi:hypothetical protein